MEGTVDFPWNPIPTVDVVQLLAIECHALLNASGRPPRGPARAWSVMIRRNPRYP